MRRTLQILMLLLSLLLVNTLSAKEKAKRGAILISNNQLCEADNMVNLSLDIKVLGEATVDYEAIRLVPKLISEQNVEFFPDLMLQGKNKRKTYNRWLKTMSRAERKEFIEPYKIVQFNPKLDTTIRYDVAIPYRGWMENAVLAVDKEVIGYNDQRSLTVIALGGVVKLQPREPYKVNPLVNYIEPEKETLKKRKVQGRAYIDFPVAGAQVMADYRDNRRELNQIEATFNELGINNGVSIEKMFMVGYASPEGNTASNLALSGRRAQALKDYMFKTFNLPMSRSQVSVTAAGEDWEGLYQLVEESDIAMKHTVIDIIENPNISFGAKNARLKLISEGAVYKRLLDEIYPKLRRVDYLVDFVVKEYSLEEAKGQLQLDSELLSHYELYKVALSAGEETEEFERIIFDIIPSYYTESKVAMINAAAVMIGRGEVMSAKRILDGCAEMPQSWNNLGVTYLLLGELESAEALFNKALSQGVSQATENLNELEKKRMDNERVKKYRDR